MKKNIKSSQQQLFEMMSKVNSDFKPKELINENKRAIIDSSHEKLFEMMSKVNSKFKHTLNEDNNFQNSAGISDFEPNSPVYKEKTEKIKRIVDDLYNNQDYDILDTMYRLFVSRKQNPNSLQEDTNDYFKKIELLKGKLDFLYDTKHFDMIDKVDQIMDKIFSNNKNNPEPENNSQLDLNENKTGIDLISQIIKKNSKMILNESITVKKSIEIISENIKKKTI